MRSLVVGYGVQGKKRTRIAGEECVGIVDPVSKEADYQFLEQVPLDLYDACLLCTPDSAKFDLVKYCLENRKHVLVEKPLFFDNEQQNKEIVELSAQAVCYTAYNHRFEPHFVRLKNLIDSGVLGKIYHCKLFYGNGTAQLAKNSPWRDQGDGVVLDLGSHLLDTILFWFDNKDVKFQRVSVRNHENLAPDYAYLISKDNIEIHIEMSLLSWKNSFACDIFAEKGSVHIDSLCKWGPSVFTHRKREFPSGVPDEECITLKTPDPTWKAEYNYFKDLCKEKGMGTNIQNDLWIHNNLKSD